jgi:8-oxo-dGTP diphosphatase
MEHRIRAAAIVVNNGKLLLVKHRHPVTSFEWWVPPGGALTNEETLYNCAVRETYEETGLTVELGQVLYLREFLDLEFRRHNLEFFILANSYKGTLTMKNLRPEDMDSHFIKTVKFLSPKEMKNLTIFPEILKDEFWHDLTSGQLTTRYLGQQSG